MRLRCSAIYKKRQAKEHNTKDRNGEILALSVSKEQHGEENAEHTWNRETQQPRHGADLSNVSAKLRDDGLWQDHHAEHKQRHGDKNEHKHNDTASLDG